MKKVKNALALVFAVVLCACFMTACGDNDKKIEQIQAAYQELVTLSNENTAQIEEAIASYADLDQQIIEEYNQAMQWIQDFGQIDLSGKSDEELDAVMNEISTMKETINRTIGMISTANELAGAGE